MKDYLTFIRMLDESYAHYDIRYTKKFVEITVYSYLDDSSLIFKFFNENEGELYEVI